MSPKPFNIDTVADAAWAIIQSFPEHKTVKSLSSHIGPDGTAIVNRQFSVGWLNKIKVNAAVPQVPVPTLKQMATVNLGIPMRTRWRPPERVLMWNYI